MTPDTRPNLSPQLTQTEQMLVENELLSVPGQLMPTGVSRGLRWDNGSNRCQLALTPLQLTLFSVSIAVGWAYVNWDGNAGYEPAKGTVFI